MAKSILQLFIAETQELEFICPLCDGQHGNNAHCQLDYQIANHGWGL